jgi:phage tail sheath protein FI
VVAAYPFTTDGNGNITPGTVSDEAGFLVGSFAGSGATLYVSANSSVLMELDASGEPTGAAVNELTVTGSTITLDSVKYVVESLYEGAGYNLGTKSDGSVSGNSIEIDSKGGPNFIVTLNDKGALKESFKASLIDKKNFLTDVINTSEANAVSDYIQGNIFEADAKIANPDKMTAFADQITALIAADDVTMVSGSTTINNAIPRFVKLVQGTYGLKDGHNGSPSNNFLEFIIGDSANKTGIYALDDDQLNLTIGLVPGLADQRIQNALINLAETSQNFIACVAPPYAVDSPQEAIDWSNGFSETRTAAINSSYAAIYWPWVKTFIPSLGEDKWMDPAIYGARQIAYTAGVAELWFAPAGFIRGRLTKPTQTQVALNQGDRDSLYSGGNAINPIVNFPQQGITIFGQRTAQREPTALDRVNVRMLMIYLRKVLLLSTQRFAFEPNDAILWAQIEETVNPLLDDIKRRRGITEFRVICDETVNTPVRVDRNEVWCKILIKPTKAAEAVIFELNVTSQSAKIVG